MQSIHSAQSPAAATGPAARTLDVDDLTVRYGQTLAVDGVTLAIEPGEVVALLGPSGCGKTTLLRVIAGFVRQAAGRVLVDGAAIDHLPANQRNVGIVFQNYALFPHMTVTENVAYGLRARGQRGGAVDDRVARMLDMVQLGDFRERLPRQLSGGQQQRVALARALAVQPSILLLDEPFAALDRNLRLDMQIEVKRLQRQLGLTTILVTHDQDEAMSVADRIAVMNKGTVEQFDTPVAIYDRPQTLFVNGFIGTTNLLARQGNGARQPYRHRGARRRRQPAPARCRRHRGRRRRPALGPARATRAVARRHAGKLADPARPQPAARLADHPRGAHVRRGGAQDRRAAPARAGRRRARLLRAGARCPSLAFPAFHPDSNGVTP